MMHCQGQEKRWRSSRFQDSSRPFGAHIVAMNLPAHAESVGADALMIGLPIAAQQLRMAVSGDQPHRVPRAANRHDPA
jgi:hypothetical protein